MKRTKITLVVLILLTIVSAIAKALYALKALQENNLLKNAQIIVAFTGDEESTGKPLTISRKDLVDAAKRSDIALGFETSTGFNYATVARRGSSGWKLEVEGKRAHSSGIFNERVGAGAIFEMSRILTRLSKLLSFKVFRKEIMELISLTLRRSSFTKGSSCFFEMFGLRVFPFAMSS